MTDPLQQLRDRPMVFVDDLGAPALGDGDRRHLERSLRLRPGDPLTVSDGSGAWRAARFGQIIEPDGPAVTEARAGPRLVIGFAPVKGDRSDLVVQKLTELGIDVIVPVSTARTVVRWGPDRVAKQLDRHRRIAREAAMQSRNPWLPTIEPLTELAEFVAAEPAVAMADPAGLPLGPEHPVLAIGPEGGFAPHELEGRPSVRLPGRILRTETAAIVAGALAASWRAR